MASFNSSLPNIGIVDDSGLGGESFFPIAKDIDDFTSEVSEVAHDVSLRLKPDFTKTARALEGKVSLLTQALDELRLQETQMQTVDALVDSHLTTANGEIDHLNLLRSPAVENASLIDGDITFSSFKSSAEKKSSIDYLAPERASQKSITERKALTALVLDEDSTLLTGYKAAKAAGGLLLYPALKSHEIAQQVLREQHPISVNTALSLGSGSFASVHPSSLGDTPCAAKKLHSRPNVKENLESEYRTLAPFHHPHIIGLQLVDPDNDTIHLELAEGGSLTSKQPGPSQKETLLDLEFVTIAHQTADALTHIHEQGFVHRDIKPDNILLTSAKETKISDFGTVTSSENFVPGDLKGTIYYLPPEYLKGASTKENCQKIDVWSFGMLL